MTPLRTRSVWKVASFAQIVGDGFTASAFAGDVEKQSTGKLIPSALGGASGTGGVSHVSFAQ